MPMFEVSRTDRGATIHVNIRDAQACAEYFAAKAKNKAYRLEEYSQEELSIIPEYAGYRVWRVVSTFNGSVRHMIKVKQVPIVGKSDSQDVQDEHSEK